MQIVVFRQVESSSSRCKILTALMLQNAVGVTAKYAISRILTFHIHQSRFCHLLHLVSLLPTGSAFVSLLLLHRLAIMGAGFAQALFALDAADGQVQSASLIWNGLLQAMLGYVKKSGECSPVLITLQLARFR